MTMAIAAGRFKASCLELLDAVAASQEALVITKYGRRLDTKPATDRSLPAHAGKRYPNVLVYTSSA
jgi:hypothetical protein